MAIIDLNQCFPESATGSRGPLPKQSLFINSALDPKGPKFVAYVGGIGSGKTLIGCITMLAMAIQHPGDYLIARQFYPELRDTTYKTFKEICPPELIVEDRIADKIIKLRSSGGVSTILFRPLEEPDKLRSLNLSGAYIDEASQVSEAAFMLLQGRLRGKGLRKLILTSNPKGHDWIYRWFLKKDHIKDAAVKDQYSLIKAPSTENVHLPEGYISSIMATWSEEQVRREIFGDFDSFEGQIYNEFSREIHVVKAFKIPDEWERVIGIDHGYRNPAAFIWAAVDYDANIWVYREFYKREWLIEEICKGKDGEPGVNHYLKGEKIQQARIDPSTKAVRGQLGLSDWDHYLEFLPKGFPLLPANNDVSAGIEKVKQYMKPDVKTKKPRIFIFDTCTNLLDEIAQYRWKELTPGQDGKQNQKEEPVKHNDHAVDALRYLIMALPEAPRREEEIYKTMKYHSLEGSLYREIQGMKTKSKKADPWGDT